MNGKHISKYRSKGYICKVGEVIEVSIVDLPFESNLFIDVKCDVCGTEKKLKYQVYNKNFFNNYYYACSILCGMDKFRNNNLIKYGVDNYSKTKECRIKTEKTCLLKYNELVPSRNKDVMSKIKETRIKKGLQTPVGSEDDFTIYKKIVRKLTQLNKKKLIESWSGYDYYDNEYIRENFELNSNSRLYPTIDHKISVFNGFYDNILPQVIAGLDNLCITKRSINSSKQINNTWKI